MEGKAALIAALVSGGLAIAIVAIDLEFGVEAALQEPDGDDWLDAAEMKGSYSDEFHDCVGQDLRFEVENEWIWGTSVDVRIAYYNSSKGAETLVLQETWQLSAGEARHYEFMVPDGAFEDQNGPEGLRFPGAASVSIQLDDRHLRVCVEDTS